MNATEISPLPQTKNYANFWVNELDAAHILGLSVHTLRAMRAKGRQGPTYSKVGRAVRYSYDDLDEFMQSRRIQNNWLF